VFAKPQFIIDASIGTYLFFFNLGLMQVPYEKRLQEVREFYAERKGRCTKTDVAIHFACQYGREFVRSALADLKHELPFLHDKQVPVSQALGPLPKPSEGVHSVALFAAEFDEECRPSVGLSPEDTAFVPRPLIPGVASCSLAEAVSLGELPRSVVQFPDNLRHRRDSRPHAKQPHRSGQFHNVHVKRHAELAKLLDGMETGLQKLCSSNIGVPVAVIAQRRSEGLTYAQIVSRDDRPPVATTRNHSSTLLSIMANRKFMEKHSQNLQRQAALSLSPFAVPRDQEFEDTGFHSVIQSGVVRLSLTGLGGLLFFPGIHRYPYYVVTNLYDEPGPTPVIYMWGTIANAKYAPLVLDVTAPGPTQGYAHFPALLNTNYDPVKLLSSQVQIDFGMQSTFVLTLPGVCGSTMVSGIDQNVNDITSLCPVERQPMGAYSGVLGPVSTMPTYMTQVGITTDTGSFQPGGFVDVQYDQIFVSMAPMLTTTLSAMPTVTNLFAGQGGGLSQVLSYNSAPIVDINQSTPFDFNITLTALCDPPTIPFTVAFLAYVTTTKAIIDVVGAAETTYSETTQLDLGVWTIETAGGLAAYYSFTNRLFSVWDPSTIGYSVSVFTSTVAGTPPHIFGTCLMSGNIEQPLPCPRPAIFSVNMSTAAQTTVSITANPSIQPTPSQELILGVMPDNAAARELRSDIELMMPSAATHAPGVFQKIDAWEVSPGIEMQGQPTAAVLPAAQPSPHEGTFFLPMLGNLLSSALPAIAGVAKNILGGALSGGANAAKEEVQRRLPSRPAIRDADLDELEELRAENRRLRRARPKAPMIEEEDALKVVRGRKKETKKTVNEERAVAQAVDGLLKHVRASASGGGAKKKGKKPHTASLLWAGPMPVASQASHLVSLRLQSDGAVEDTTQEVAPFQCFYTGVALSSGSYVVSILSGVMVLSASGATSGRQLSYQLFPPPPDFSGAAVLTFAGHYLTIAPSETVTLDRGPRPMPSASFSRVTLSQEPYVLDSQTVAKAAAGRLMPVQYGVGVDCQKEDYAPGEDVAGSLWMLFKTDRPCVLSLSKTLVNCRYVAVGPKGTMVHDRLLKTLFLVDPKMDVSTAMVQHMFQDASAKLVLEKLADNPAYYTSLDSVDRVGRPLHMAFGGSLGAAIVALAGQTEPLEINNGFLQVHTGTGGRVDGIYVGGVQAKARFLRAAFNYPECLGPVQLPSTLRGLQLRVDNGKTAELYTISHGGISVRINGGRSHDVASRGDARAVPTS